MNNDSGRNVSCPYKLYKSVNFQCLNHTSYINYRHQLIYVIISAEHF